MLAEVIGYTDLSHFSTAVDTMAEEDYARVLYDNYRARIIASSRSLSVPSWENVSPMVRREFIRDARQELGL